MAPTPFYEETGIRLYQGDCLEVLPALGIKPGDVTLLWADVPYGVNERTDRKSKGRSNAAECYDFAPVAGDDRPFDPAPWLEYPRAVLWGANHYAARLPSRACWWVWDKREGMTPNDNADCEMAWTNLPGPARLFHHLWNGMIKGSEREARRVHPTQKPEALATWGFQRAGLKRGDLVVSPYLGSGPEAAAAKRLGLHFIGIELVPEYLSACVDRLRQGVLL
jgi:site-specific DNA-methyltransferase (adenine-specific)